MSANQQKLSTPEAQNYLESSPENFTNDPLGFMLYNYYQKIYQEYLAEKKITEELAKEQIFLDEQKEIADELRQQAIEEYQPSIGIFSGDPYENYVNSLDEEVRDTVVKHLEFTKNLVEEAQTLRNEILEKGGSAEEAQAAYLEKISTSRDMIENLDNPDYDKTNLDSEETNENIQDSIDSEIDEPINEELPEKSSIQLDVEGVNLEVDFDDSIFFVNVNGKVLKFAVNGNEITLVEDLK